MRSQKAVRRIMNQLNVYTNTLLRQTELSPTIYIEKTCVRLLDSLQGYQAEDALTGLQQDITTFDDLRSDILGLEAELVLLGVSAEMKILRDTSLRINHIIYCLEELWYLGSQGYAALDSVYKTNELLYQS
jgi:hypothetical protein